MATGEAPDHQLALDQQNLFPVPLWAVDLTPYLGDQVDTMIADVEALIDEDPAAAPFEQSRAALGNVTTEPWPRYHQVVTDIAGGLLEQAWSRSGYEVGHLSTWGLRMKGPSGGGPLRHLHTHPRAVISTVLYLRVPDELVGSPYGGTLFRDPNAANTSYMLDRPLARIPAQPLRLLLFPAWLEHTPSEPPSPEPYSVPRLVVATDVICL